MNMGLCDEGFFPRTNTCTSQLIPFPIHRLEGSQQQQSFNRVAVYTDFFFHPLVLIQSVMLQKSEKDKKRGKSHTGNGSKEYLWAVSKEETTVIKILRYTEKF